MTADGTVRPLDPRSFAFYGFGDLAGVAARVRGVGIRSGPRSVAVVEDGVYVPAPRRRHDAGRQARFPGGIVAADGRPVTAAHLRRRGDELIGGLTEATAVAAAQEIDEEVVYLGWLHGRYGHFLLESLARTWILPEVDPSTRVLFHAWHEVRREGTIGEILDALGLPAGRVLIPDRPTRVRRLLVPEPLYELGFAAHERAAEPFRAVAARLVDPGDTTDRPVYLSRRRLPGSLRAVVGEEELERVMRDAGFAIAYPETLPFAAQVRLVNRHRDIFTSDGSAAYTVLFALNGPRLHFLTNGASVPDYFLATELAGADATFVDCLADGAVDPSDRRAPLLADVPKFVGYLRQRGFLEGHDEPDTAAGKTVAGADPHREAQLYHQLTKAARSAEPAPELEREGEARAAASWTLSLALARYYARHDPPRVDALVRQFVRGVSAESSAERLAQYRPDAEKLWVQVAKAIEPATAADLRAIMSQRFQVDTAAIERRGTRRRQRTTGGNVARTPERAGRKAL